MKVLFIGIGLSHYYNRVLNKLNQESAVKVFNLVEAQGKSDVAEGVFETDSGIEFEVVKAFKKYFFEKGVFWMGFEGLKEILEKIHPEVIVLPEEYVPMFIYDEASNSVRQKLKIKLLMKSIPFRLPTYQELLERINSGEIEIDEIWFRYQPKFLLWLESFSDLKPGYFIFKVINKFFHLFGLIKIHFRIFSKRIFLEKLAERKKVFNFVDGHVAYTEEAFRIFGSFAVSKEKIFIIGNSPDTDLLFSIRKNIEKEPLILPVNPYRLIHLSRLSASKKVDLLIKVLAKLKKKFSKAELVVIGDGPERQNLENLAQELGVADSVLFLGGIFNPELMGRYLLASSIYVLAGMGGLSINDAMSFGKPVICSVCDGTEKKLVFEGRNGLYFKENNLDDLTQKIEFLFDHPESVEEMGKQSTAIIKNEINIHSVINGYLKAFKYVAEN